jgi:O-antigen ligase/tetratricopeptide (TPR) repeat protein
MGFLGRIALVLFLVAAFGVPLLFQTDSTWSTLPKLVVLVAASGGLLVILGLHLARRGQVAPDYPRAVMPALAAVVIVTLGRSISGQILPLGMDRILTLSSGVALFVCISAIGGDLGRERLFWMLLAGGAAAFLAGILWEPGLAGLLGLSQNEAFRISGTLCNANLLGSFSGALLFPGLIFLVSRPWQAAYRIGSAALFAAIAIAALAQSGTRASLVGLAASAGVSCFLLIRNRRALRSKGLNATGLASSIAVLLIIAVIAGGSIRDFTARETVEARITIWDGALRMFLEKPVFGWGAGQFQSFFPLFRPTNFAMRGVTANTAHAHCEPLDILIESGVVGLALWGVVGALWLASVIRRGFGDWTGVAALSGVAFLVVESLGSIALRWTPSAFLLALFAGLAAGGGSRRTPGAPRVLAVISLLSGAALLVPGSLAALRMLGSSQHLYTAKVVCFDRVAYAMTDMSMDCAGRLGLALDLCDRSSFECAAALRLYPDDPAALYTLGNSHIEKAAILALEVPGEGDYEAAGVRPDLPSAAAELREALAAYGALAMLAPDYADSRLNQVHLYSRLGRFDEAAATSFALQRSRPDLAEYCMEFVEQVAPLCQGLAPSSAMEAKVLDILAEQGDSRNDMRNEEPRPIEQGLRLILAFQAIRSRPAADSLITGMRSYLEDSGRPLADLPPDLDLEIQLADEGRETIDRYEAGDTAGIYSYCSGIVESSRAYAPLQRYILVRLAADRGYSAIGPVASELASVIRWFGFSRVGLLPGRADYLVSCARLAACRGQSFDSEVFEAASSLSLAMDFVEFRSVRLLSLCYSRPEEGAAAESVLTEWLGIGGPMACKAAGYLEGPSLPGSHLDSITIIIDQASIDRPSDPAVALARFGHYTRLLFCWMQKPDPQAPAGLLAKLAESRNALSRLLGEEQAAAAINEYLSGSIGLRDVPCDEPASGELAGLVDAAVRASRAEQ